MQKKVHFMGIGGSGMSGVALLAKAQGFEVTGCDLQTTTPYLEKLKKIGIPVFQGHDPNHLENVDILAVTPAAFFQETEHPELTKGKTKKVMTWQAFSGTYLQKEKQVICVAGTHGKSTTTAMLARVFEDAQKDPWVMIGATIPEWESNARVGHSDIFITESDEFFDNFLNYSPDTIILNNIELDHPDYFHSYDQLLQSFKQHVESLRGNKRLIVNQDSPGIVDLFAKLDKQLLASLQITGYTTTNTPLLTCDKSVKAESIKLDSDGSHFVVNKNQYSLTIPGIYNISNALGVVICSQLSGVSEDIIVKSLQQFKGIGRRMEKLGENSLGAVIYDDYAHHPTAIAETLKAVKQINPQSSIYAIIEPHTYSRTKALLPLYKGAFENADHVIVTSIFKSRETEDFGLTGETVANTADHKDIQYIEDFEEIIEFCKKKLQSGDVVIVMGAGNSYKLARMIQLL